MKLTYKQQGFINDYLSGSKELIGNGTQCAMKWFDCENEETASAISYEYLRKPHIKEYMNTKTKDVAQILTENATLLIKKAIDEANNGNTTILSKLLDKIAPTLNANDNTNTEVSVDDYLNNIVSKYVNKADSSKSIDVPQEQSPVSVDDKTS